MVIGFDGSRSFITGRTGTENYSYHLLVNLLKIDKQNRYIVYTRPGVKKGLIIQDNVSYCEIPWPRLWTQGGLSLQTFKDPLDVLFVPAHTLPLIRRPGLKTVMTVHDLGVEYLPKLHQLKQQLYLKNITRYQFISATRLIAVSKATKEDLVKRAGIDSKKISVIYEGYDKSLFRTLARNDILVNSLRRYGLQVGKYYLFVGTVQPRKNLERLIVAFSKFISRPDLVIVGSKGWLSDEVYKLPKKLGIQDKVRFLGYVPDRDMSAIYSGAEALIFPSLFEGFGLPILEAQVCGCPVITSNVSSMPEVGGKGAIYVNPNSTQDIIRGMRDLKAVREKIIKAGYENIKRFSWEKCVKETLNILETC